MLNCSNIVTPLLLQHCGEKDSHLSLYADTHCLQTQKTTNMADLRQHEDSHNLYDGCDLAV